MFGFMKKKKPESKSHLFGITPKLQPSYFPTVSGWAGEEEEQEELLPPVPQP